MQKRGQVSVFVIIGIIALALIILTFALFRSFQEKAREITNPQEYLKSQLNDIKREAAECINDETRDLLERLYAGGGHLNPLRYAQYYDKKPTVLCYKVKQDEPCHNMMFTEKEIDKELRPILEQEIKQCIDNKLIFFQDKDYTLEKGEFKLSEIIFDDKALSISIEYPIKLTKGTVEDEHTLFTTSIQTKFWKAAKIASDIIQKHTLGQEVSVSEISTSNIYFQIARTSTATGNVYMIKPRYTNDPIFYFSVET